MTTVYGISNCDTIKKARTWLSTNNIEYRFHDFRKDGLDKATVQQWLQNIAVEQLVNKRSTTWRGLEDNVKNSISDSSISEQALIQLLLENPTLIKRPVTVTDKEMATGFKDNLYQSLFL